MGRYISYATSTLFIILLGGAMVLGYQAIKPDFAILGWIMFSSVALGTPIFIGLKLYAMYQNDTLMHTQVMAAKKPPVRRVTQKKD